MAQQNNTLNTVEVIRKNTTMNNFLLNTKMLLSLLLIVSVNLIINPQLKSQNNNNSIISFIGVGDMMLGTDFPNKSYLPPNNNPMPYVSEAISYLTSADITFGNLEGCFLDEGPVIKRCKDTTKCYAFKMPESYAAVFKEMGFDFLNLANNHIRDFGQAGLKTTSYHLDKQNIKWAGLLSKPTDTMNVKGVKIGFAGFSPNTGTVDINDLPNAIRIVKDLKSKCDIVMVSFHGGAEGSKHQHVTRKGEIFYGENRSNVYEFAHAMIDAGADIIFGHGPHVLRAIEIYKNRFIAYSLGNFASYSRFNLSGPNALAPIVKIKTNRKGEFISGKIIPFKQAKGVALTYDHSKGAIKKIKDLTSIDFPELHNRLIIEPNGKFSMPFDKKIKPIKANFKNYSAIDVKELM